MDMKYFFQHTETKNHGDFGVVTWGQGSDHVNGLNSKVTLVPHFIRYKAFGFLWLYWGPFQRVMLKTCNFTKMDIIISQHCRPGSSDCTEPDTCPKFNRSESNRSPLKSDGWKTIVSNGLFSVVFAVTFQDLGSVSNQGSSLRAGSPSYLASKSRALKGAFVAPWTSTKKQTMMAQQ